MCGPDGSSLKSPAKLREELGVLWLSTLADQHRESSETWKALETKGQGTITVAGIFLAAVFAFAREADSIDAFPRVLIGLTTILLVASVAVALLSLEIRPVAAPPLGDFVGPGAADLIKLPDAELTEARIAVFVVDRATEWKSANDSLSTENLKKAKHVWRSQILLGTAAVPVAAVTIIVLL